MKCFPVSLKKVKNYKLLKAPQSYFYNEESKKSKTFIVKIQTCSGEFFGLLLAVGKVPAKLLGEILR